MTTDFDVITIGNAIVDVIAQAEDSFLEEYSVVKGSMNLIDEERAEQLYNAMGPALESSGGSASNTAAGVAALGGKAAYIGKVKQDTLGDIFNHDIKAIGVDFASERAIEGPATARSFILVTPDAQRTMNTYLGACVNLTVNDIDPDYIARGQVTYMEGYLWDRDEAKDAFIKAAKAATDAGREASLSLSDTFCVDRHRESFQDLVEGHIDLLFANEEEIKALYQLDDFDAALEKMRDKCKITAVTRGEKGSVILAGDQTITVAAAAVDKVVDTTGAGDAYAAGFLYGYTQGKDLETCAKLGGIAAAEVISHYGPRPEANLKELAKAVL